MRYHTSFPAAVYAELLWNANFGGFCVFALMGWGESAQSRHFFFQWDGITGPSNRDSGQNERTLSRPISNICACGKSHRKVTLFTSSYDWLLLRNMIPVVLVLKFLSLFISLFVVLTWVDNNHCSVWSTVRSLSNGTPPSVTNKF